MYDIAYLFRFIGMAGTCTGYTQKIIRTMLRSGILLSLLWCVQLHAQPLPPKTAYPLNVKQLHCGHSLTDPLFHPWPGQYRFLIYDVLGGEFDHVGKSTIPGSSLRYRWENDPQWDQPWARHDIHEWELLCITESVPLHYVGGGNAPWYLERLEEQRHYLRLFVNQAWEQGNNGAGAPTLLWTTWTNIDDSDGPWRDLLNVYETEWETMQDSANAHRPDGAPPVYLIPGHRMMARLYDDIALGVVPGITSIAEFFSDNIHVNPLGSYAVAMIHYACVYNTSPVGLPVDLLNGSHEAPSPALALYLQTMIWEVVTTYPRTGITDPSTAVDGTDVGTETHAFSVYPNPASTYLHIHIESDDYVGVNPEITLINPSGKVVYQGRSHLIDIQPFPPGVYWVRVGERTQKIVKQYLH